MENDDKIQKSIALIIGAAGAAVGLFYGLSNWGVTAALILAVGGWIAGWLLGYGFVTVLGHALGWALISLFFLVTIVVVIAFFHLIQFAFSN
jgi:hypothetical protein